LLSDREFVTAIEHRCRTRLAVAVLLLASCCASEFGLQMVALDPARPGVTVDPQGLRKTVGGVEAPVMLTASDSA
jgi:hypothetical protein